MSAKLFLKVMFSCLGGALMGIALAHGADRGDYQNAKPLDIVQDVVNQEDSGIIETELAQVDSTSGSPFGANFKISNTLDSVRVHMSTYLERIVFLGLSAAVALIVYNGLRLVLSPLSEGEAQKVKKRILYIVLGILLMTGFYFVIVVLLNVFLDIAL